MTGLTIRALVVFITWAASPLWAGEGFEMADTLDCTIESSSAPAETDRKFKLSGLTTAGPQAVFDNHVRSSMTAIFESEKTLVIQLVAAVSGSTDTIVLDKSSGRFARAAAGVFLELHALAQTGTCRPD